MNVYTSRLPFLAMCIFHFSHVRRNDECSTKEIRFNNAITVTESVQCSSKRCMFAVPYTNQIYTTNQMRRDRERKRNKTYTHAEQNSSEKECFNTESPKIVRKKEQITKMYPHVKSANFSSSIFQLNFIFTAIRS